MFKNLINSIRTRWNHLSNTEKLGVAAVSILVIVILVVVIF